jgi:hypothetical protein
MVDLQSSFNVINEFNEINKSLDCFKENSELIVFIEYFMSIYENYKDLSTTELESVLQKLEKIKILVQDNENILNNDKFEFLQLISKLTKTLNTLIVNNIVSSF